MKSNLLLGFSLLLLVFTTSCNFTENITINEDGTGNVTMDVDASQLMAMAGDQMAQEGAEKTDTTILFKDILASKKDSIAKLPKGEQDRLKKLENFRMRMQMDPEEKQFSFSLLNDFKKVEDLDDLMGAFDQANPMNKKQEEIPDFGLDKYKTKSSYFYDGKKFKKMVSRLQELPVMEKDSMIESMMAMFETSTYTVNYKFPKRVKSVSNKTAKISTDKKAVTIVYPFTDYLDKPKDMSLEVEFEK